MFQISEVELVGSDFKYDLKSPKGQTCAHAGKNIQVQWKNKKMSEVTKSQRNPYAFYNFLFEVGTVSVCKMVL